VFVYKFILFLLKFTTHEHHLLDYMERYWIILPRNKKIPSIRLHHLLSSDSDRALHDHPWWYFSIILSGGYWEVTWVDALAYVDAPWEYADYELVLDVHTFDIVYLKRWYGPGSILFRKASHLHRLILPNTFERKAETWTLFISGPKSKEWGFMTDCGWIKWDEYESPDEVAYHKGKG